jgi:hypothetical protein
LLTFSLLAEQSYQHQPPMDEIPPLDIDAFDPDWLNDVDLLHAMPKLSKALKAQVVEQELMAKEKESKARIARLECEIVEANERSAYWRKVAQSVPDSSVDKSRILQLEYELAAEKVTKSYWRRTALKDLDANEIKKKEVQLTEDMENWDRGIL